MDIHSHLSNIEPVALEALYRQFLEDPTSVDDSWRHFFLGFDLARKEFGDEEALPVARILHPSDRCLSALIQRRASRLFALNRLF